MQLSDTNCLKGHRSKLNTCSTSSIGIKLYHTKAMHLHVEHCIMFTLKNERTTYLLMRIEIGQRTNSAQNKNENSKFYPAIFSTLVRTKLYVTLCLKQLGENAKKKQCPHKSTFNEFHLNQIYWYRKQHEGHQHQNTVLNSK